MTEPLVDAATIAEHLGVPVSWVREQTRLGAIPHVSLGRYVRYRLSTVDQWARDRERATRRIGGRPLR